MTFRKSKDVLPMRLSIKLTFPSFTAILRIMRRLSRRSRLDVFRRHRYFEWRLGRDGNYPPPDSEVQSCSSIRPRYRLGAANAGPGKPQVWDKCYADFTWAAC